MEQGRINIDLHAIFKQLSHNSQEDQGQTSQDLYEHPSNIYQSASIDLSEIKSMNTLPQPNSSKINRTLHSVVSAETQLQNLTKLIKQKETTIKRIQSFDTARLTARLSQKKQSACQRCHKQNSNNHVCKEKSPKQQKKNQVKKDSRSISDVHERLYNMSKSQILKQMYIPEQQGEPNKKTHRKSASSLSTSKYLKNYTPFEKRLEEYLNREQFASNQSLLKSQTEFRPQLIPNKYSSRVSSRYRDSHLKEGKAVDFADFLNSSVSSSQVSSTSQSAQLAMRIEQHFLRKMRLVFVKSPHQEVQVNETVIGLLTEVEFNILQPFIMQLEESPIKGEDFQAHFRVFYDNLNTADKIQLRNHELKSKAKYREIKQQLKKQKSSKIELFKIVQKPIPKLINKPVQKKESKADSNYHLVIQNFI